MKVKTTIHKEKNDYFANLFLNGEMTATKIKLVFCYKEMTQRIDNNKPNCKWILTGNVNSQNYFLVQHLKADHLQKKKSIINHKPILNESPYNPAGVKGRNKIGLGINTTKNRIQAQIIKKIIEELSE